VLVHLTESQTDYDHLWKDVITDLFEEFLLFFSPELYEQVNFTIPPAFLEQELKTISPESDSNHRISDKLVKLKLYTGEEQWVYVHVEIQGDVKGDFSKRMFQYFYRILDKFDQPVYAIAIFTSKNPTNKLDSYRYHFYGTKVKYTYNTYRIASQSEQELLKSHNPFAIAVLAGLYLNNSKIDNEMKYKYKRKLIRLLLQDKMRVREENKEIVKKLFIFIDHLLKIPQEAQDKLVQELKPIIDQEGVKLGLSLEDTSFAKYFKKEGFEEGIEKGIEKGRKEGAREIAKKLLQSGFTMEVVAENTGVTVEELKEIQKEI